MVRQQYPTLGFCKNKLRKYAYVFSATPGSWQILNNCSLSFFSNAFIAVSALCWSSVLFPWAVNLQVTGYNYNFCVLGIQSSV